MSTQDFIEVFEKWTAEILDLDKRYSDEREQITAEMIQAMRATSDPDSVIVETNQKLDELEERRKVERDSIESRWREKIDELRS